MQTRFFALGVAMALGFSSSGVANDANTAAPDRAAVIAVAEELFAAMAAHDGARLRQVLLPQAVFFVMDSSKPEEPVRTSTAAAFIEAIEKTPALLLERAWDPQVQIDGNLATLWAPYDVHRDGKLSHCGYDAFHFVRLEGRWRMAVVSYTKHPPEKCPRRS